MLLLMGDLRAPGIEPMSPALADGFLTTKPSGKPRCYNQRFLKDPTVQALLCTSRVVGQPPADPSRNPPSCLSPVRVFKGTVVSESVQPDLQWSINLPDGSGVKGPPVNAGDLGLIPGWGRCPGGGNGKPLQSSCLGNPMHRGAWWATVPAVERLGHK